MISLFLSCILVCVSIAQNTTPEYRNIQCEPVQEFLPLRINISASKLLNYPRIEKDKVIVAIGGTEKKWTVLYPVEVIHQTSDSGAWNLLITIANATVKESNYSSGEWSLIDSDNPELKKFCTIVAMNKSIHCSKHATDSSLDIVCTAQKVYPRAKCYFLYFHNGQSKPLAEDMISYSHKTDSSDPSYKTSTCKISVPWADVPAASFSLSVSMFPNATGEESDRKFGVTENVKVDRDVFISCSPAQEGGVSNLTVVWNNEVALRVSRGDGIHGDNITCSPQDPCIASVGQRHTTSEDQTPEGYSRLIVSLYDVKRSGRGGSRDDTWTLRTYGREMKTECRIFSKPELIRCENSVTSDGVNITCHGVKIYPAGLCTFYIARKTKEEVINDVTVHNDKKDFGGLHFYDTVCTTLIGWKQITSQRLEVKVKVFPNVTGKSAEDERYGNVTMVAVQLEGPSVTLDQCPLRIERGHNVTCVCKADSSNVQVYWMEIGFWPQENTTAINFTATSFTTFRCQGKDITTGASGVPAVYIPDIVFPPLVEKLNKEKHNDTDVDETKLYIWCLVEQGGPRAQVALRRQADPLTWLLPEHEIRAARNKEQCDESAHFECLLLDDGKITSSENSVYKFACEADQSDSGIIAAVVVCITLLIVILIAAIFVIKRARPSFIHVNLRFRKNTGIESTSDDKTAVDQDAHYSIPSILRSKISSLVPFKSQSDDNDDYLTPA